MAKLGRWIILLLILPLVPLFGDDTDPRSLFIEGYAGKVSYAPEEEVTLHVSTTAASYSIEISRLGSKREVVLARSGVGGGAYPVPENASSHGCGWPASFAFKIPGDWKSGTTGYRSRYFRRQWTLFTRRVRTLLERP